MKKLRAVLAVLIVGVCVLGLTACGGPTPTEVTDQFFTSIQQQDKDSLKEVYSPGDMDMLSDFDEDADSSDSALDKKMMKELKAKIFAFDFVLSNEKIDGDKATVDAAITTYSLGKMFKDFVKTYFTEALSMAFDGASDAEMDKKAESIFTEKMKNVKKDYKQTITINLTKKDNKWMVNSVSKNDDFQNALTGNMIKAIQEMEKEFDGE